MTLLITNVNHENNRVLIELSLTESSIFIVKVKM